MCIVFLEFRVGLVPRNKIQVSRTSDPQYINFSDFPDVWSACGALAADPVGLWMFSPSA